jgi:hypothetical protein
MNSKELRGLYEAYTAVYDEDLRDELEEMSDEFAGIENLTDEEIDAIVEETIDEMLDEGYEFDEVEEIFEEVLSEAARMDRAAARREYMRSSEKAAREARNRGAAVVRREKRAEKIAQVKGAVKSALGKAKEAAKSVARKAIDEPARKYAERRGVVPSKSGKSTLGSGTGIQSVAYKQRTPEGRREVRARVAADIKGRIKKKIGQAQVGAYNAARRAGQAASDVAGRAKQSAKNLAARTKRGVMSTAGKAARAVSTGAGRVASRLGEEVDVYDIVLSHLLDEGYVDNFDQAEAIMANMSEEWIDNILDEACVVEGKRAQMYGQPEMNSDYDERNLRNRGDLSKRDAGSIARSRLKGQLSAVGRLRGTSPHVDGRRVNNEEVDIYDIVLSHLLDEGYADTIESAEAIMVNMSKDWREGIIDEAYVDYRKGRLPSGRTPQQAAQGRRDALDAKIEAGSLTRKRPTPKDYDRASKQSSRTREMDSHTSFGGKVNKLLNPGGWNRGSASPRVAYGEPNTDRHQLARITRDAVSRASSAQRKSRGG